MKRNCGYECTRNTTSPIPDVGDEEFIEVDTKATIQSEGGYGPPLQVDVSLVACPKCGCLYVRRFMKK